MKAARMRSAFALAAILLSAATAWSAPSSGKGDNNSSGANASSASDGHASGEGGRSSSGSEGSATSGGSPSHSGGQSASFGAFRPGSQGSYGHPNPSHPVGPAKATERGQIRAARPKLPAGRGINRSRQLEGGDQPRISRKTNVLHQREASKGNVFKTRDGKPHEGNWSRNNPENRTRFDRKAEGRLRNWQGRKSNFIEACHRHDDHHRHHHNRDWWHHHCPVIILVDWGFWGWFDGWWYPAWGYDSDYSYYEYDGPIYGYDGLLPDEVIANVQSALQELGYYPYAIDGIFGPLTQEALAKFQRDEGISVTGVIDPATVVALGLTP